jgi:hypothetical protein
MPVLKLFSTTVRLLTRLIFHSGAKFSIKFGALSLNSRGVFLQAEVLVPHARLSAWLLPPAEPRVRARDV